MELNPRLKNNWRHLKNWELLPLAILIKNRPMMEETEFFSSDSPLQIRVQASVSKCKGHRSVKKHVQGTKITLKPTKQVYPSVSAFQSKTYWWGYSICKLWFLIFKLFLITSEILFYIGNHKNNTVKLILRAHEKSFVHILHVKSILLKDFSENYFFWLPTKIISE